MSDHTEQNRFIPTLPCHLAKEGETVAKTPAELSKEDVESMAEAYYWDALKGSNYNPFEEMVKIAFETEDERLRFDVAKELAAHMRPKAKPKADVDVTQGIQVVIQTFQREGN